MGMIEQFSDISALQKEFGAFRFLFNDLDKKAANDLKLKFAASTLANYKATIKEINQVENKLNASKSNLNLKRIYLQRTLLKFCLNIGAGLKNLNKNNKEQISTILGKSLGVMMAIIEEGFTSNILASSLEIDKTEYEPLKPLNTEYPINKNEPLHSILKKEMDKYAEGGPSGPGEQPTTVPPRRPDAFNGKFNEFGKEILAIFSEIKDELNRLDKTIKHDFLVRRINRIIMRKGKSLSKGQKDFISAIAAILS